MPGEEPKDPAIKLFGKMIPFPEIPPPPRTTDYQDPKDHGETAASTTTSREDINTDDHVVEPPPATDNKVQETMDLKPSTSIQDVGTQPMDLKVSTDTDASTVINENAASSSTSKEKPSVKKPKSEDEQNETSSSQEKTLKRPDKILPCPRCNSMETKFCYYNNYNVNQPRHFCKNCQRYWTAGGTMRNVPVGAGRRKNKSSGYRHISVQEVLQSVWSDLPNGVHHPPVKADGTVLTFGSDMPFCESMASVLKLADKTVRNGTKYSGPNRNTKSGVDNSAKSSTPATHLDGFESSEILMQNCSGVGIPPLIPCCPGAPCLYPWNAIPPPPVGPPGYAMPIYPAGAYWGYGLTGAWNLPWLHQPSSPSQNTMSSGSNSPTLGKHSRDEKISNVTSLGEEEVTPKGANAERSLWIPKTLRIDDLGESAKCSIWATLGIKSSTADPSGRGVLFKAFHSKGDEKGHICEVTSPALQANPAALSRSLNFRESSA